MHSYGDEGHPGFLERTLTSSWSLWSLFVGFIVLMNGLAAFAYVNAALKLSPDVAWCKMRIDIPEKISLDQSGVPIRFFPDTHLPDDGVSLKFLIEEGSDLLTPPDQLQFRGEEAELTTQFDIVTRPDVRKEVKLKVVASEDALLYQEGSTEAPSSEIVLTTFLLPGTSTPQLQPVIVLNGPTDVVRDETFNVSIYGSHIPDNTVADVVVTSHDDVFPGNTGTWTARLTANSGTKTHTFKVPERTWTQNRQVNFDVVVSGISDARVNSLSVLLSPAVSKPKARIQLTGPESIITDDEFSVIVSGSNIPEGTAATVAISTTLGSDHSVLLTHSDPAQFVRIDVPERRWLTSRKVTIHAVASGVDTEFISDLDVVISPLQPVPDQSKIQLILIDCQRMTSFQDQVRELIELAKAHSGRLFGGGVTVMQKNGDAVLLEDDRQLGAEHAHGPSEAPKAFGNIGRYLQNSRGVRVVIVWISQFPLGLDLGPAQPADSDIHVIWVDSPEEDLRAAEPLYEWLGNDQNEVDRPIPDAMVDAVKKRLGN